MSRRFRLCVAMAALACALASCTVPPDDMACAVVSCPVPQATPQAMTAADPPAVKPNWVVKRAIAVGDVAVPRAPKGDASPSPVGEDAFRQALQNSLKNAGYLAAGPKPRYRLNATVQQLDRPPFSLKGSVTVISTVLYRLVGPGTNAQYSVTAGGAATYDQATAFGKRLQLASERALQANIETLLAKLQKF